MVLKVTFRWSSILAYIVNSRGNHLLYLARGQRRAGMVKKRKAALLLRINQYVTLCTKRACPMLKYFIFTRQQRLPITIRNRTSNLTPIEIYKYFDHCKGQYLKL